MSGASQGKEQGPNTLAELSEFRKERENQFRKGELFGATTTEANTQWYDSMDRRKGDRCCRILGRAREITRHELMTYREWGYFKFMTHTQGSVFPELWTWLVLFSVTSFLIWAGHEYDVVKLDVNADAHRLILFPIAFLLVFRANTAYARFWEGRMHFETVQFALRELTRRTYTFIKDTAEGPVDKKAQALRQNIMRMLMVLAIAVRQNLRKRTGGQDAHKKNLEAVQPYLTEKEQAEYARQVKNRPLLAMSWLGKYVHEAHVEHRLDGGIILMGFDDNISSCLQGWMGMNKVCYQPMPFPYIHFLHWAMLLWCITLPLVLVNDDIGYGWWTTLINPLVCMTLYAIEETAEEIEDPFGDDLNDLPTEEFEMGMKRDARAALSGGARERGRKGMHFESMGDNPDKNLYGIDYSLPLEDLAANEALPTPIYHDFSNPSECECVSCVLGIGPVRATSDHKKRYNAIMADRGRQVQEDPASPRSPQSRRAPTGYMHAAFPTH